MERRIMAVGLGIAGVTPAGVLAGDLLYDNGLPDGSGAYSNGTSGIFGARRTLLDDFAITDPDGWSVTGFRWQHIWNTLPPGSGTGFELSFRSDAGGTPGSTVHTAVVTAYSEFSLGMTYFAREGAESWATFDPVELATGTWWLEATIVGPENNFWLIRTQVTGNQAWVNYDDLGGLQPGVTVFGVEADLNFRLMGQALPTPGAIAALGLLAVAGRGRRR